jgi:hypothetical protein
LLNKIDDFPYLIIFTYIEFHSDIKVGNTGNSVKYVPGIPNLDTIKIKANKKTFFIATLVEAR